MKSFIATTLMFTGLALPVVAGPKYYSFTLTAPASAGGAELRPGEYKLKVEGAQAVIRDEQSGKTVSVPVKVEHNGQKYDQTTVQSNRKDGKDRIFEIHLGGSDTKLEVE